MEAGEQLPDLSVTPDRFLTVRYAGASGDFNPIHIDEDFARSVGLPGRILHGLWTMAQVARAQTEAAGGPDKLRAPVGPVPRHGRARAGGRRQLDGARGRRRRRRRGGRGAPGRHPHRPPRPGGDRSSPRLRRVLSPRQELLLAKVIDCFSATRPAGRLEGARRRSRCPGRIRRRSATSSPCSRSWGCSRIRTPRRAGRRPMPATATTSTSCCPPVAAPSSSRRTAIDAHARAPRGRRGDAPDHRDALAGHRPARDRVRAADPDDDDPPRRGPAAAAPGPDGGDHHLHGRRLQAAVHLRAPGRLRPRRLGGRVPQRGARRQGPGRADAALAPHRPDAAADRARFLEGLAPAFIELAETAEDVALRGRRRAPARRAPLPGRLPAQRAAGHARAPRLAARRALGRARPARLLRAHRRRERRHPRCAACRSSPPTTACRSATSARSR